MVEVADNALQPGDGLLRQALDLSTEAVVLLESAAARADTHSPQVRYANSQFTRLSGFTVDELVTLSWADICRDICASDIVDALHQHGSYCGTLLMERADGTRWRSGVRIRALSDEQGDADTWLCQLMPCAFMANGEADFAAMWFDSESTATRGRFSRLDRVDSSSGLLRFERFSEFLERDIALAARQKTPATVMLLKVLEFDEYRCTFGVNAANSCLRTIGKQVTAALRRRTDLCARMSDDTIVAAIIGQTAEDGWKILERICTKVDGLRVHNPRGRASRFLSLQCAVASGWPFEESCSAESLLAAAQCELDRAATETLTA
jgi:diguanylate cyclase (GGDEF)-like protein